MVISRRKNQWYKVSQFLLEQNIWQSWLLMFLPTKLAVLLKKIFFFSLKSTKITSKIKISELCDLLVMLVMWHSFINMLFISTEIFDKLRPQILSVGTTANSPLKEFKHVIFLCLINIKSQSTSNLLFKSHNAIGFYAKTMSAHGSHLGWRSWSPDAILKVYYPRTIHAMFALNWLTGFRREDF
jgi:hypothetical protein